MNAVNTKKGDVFSLYGEVVINVASTGIAALLLSGGNDVTALLNKAGLIIWDEAPMMHCHCFEAVDRTLRDIILPSDIDKPFGGKTIVFGGDFRQILPVIQRGNRSDIV
uniref:ATP-dependent DNA helicase n=1 Tax=Lactuca sativa TaxID=4236 RepID=A0A9R1W7S3_LACSA|nr:hypothetical protein LSAT_V11C200058070 [Lactuca sativa]